MTIDWQPRAAALAEELTAGGALSDPRWAAAVRATPRHVFVPRFYDQHPDLSGWQEISPDTEPDRWAAAVFSDRTLVTELRSRPDVFDGFPVPVSSSTLPSLMLRMLHVLRRTGTTEDGRPVTILRAGDGSWVRAEHLAGGAAVRVGGPTDMWRIVEDAHDRWTAMSRPGWDRFGVSVTQDVQTVWLDEPGHELARQALRAAIA